MMQRQCNFSLCFHLLRQILCHFSTWPGLGIHFVPENVGFLDKLPDCSPRVCFHKELYVLLQLELDFSSQVQIFHNDVFFCGWKFQHQSVDFLTSKHLLCFASNSYIIQVRLWMKPDFKLCEEKQRELIDIQDQSYPVTYCEACVEMRNFFQIDLLIAGN